MHSPNLNGELGGEGMVTGCKCAAANILNVAFEKQMKIIILTIILNTLHV